MITSISRSCRYRAMGPILLSIFVAASAADGIVIQMEE